MRHSIRAVGVLIMVVVFGFAGMAPASAAPTADVTAAAASDNCNHSLGGGAVVRSAQYLTGRIGTVQLCRDSSYRYWAYIVLYRPLASGDSAQASLEVHRNGSWWTAPTCDSPGGNKYVTAGQTRCWTPKFTAGSADSFIALGWVYHSPRPGPNQFAQAETALCPRTGNCYA